MSSGARGLILSCVIAAFAAATCVTASAQDGLDLRISGSYKNLLQDGQTWSGQSATLDTNRLHLKIKGRLSPALRFDVQYDNELLLGSYVRRAGFRQQAALAELPYWPAQADYLDGSGLYGAHRLYRAQLQGDWGDSGLRLGRQRIAWGTGRFWSPLDLLNPQSPLALERELRPGVDALLLEQRFGPLAQFSAVLVPAHRGQAASRTLRWHANTRGIDYSLTAGRFSGTHVFGFDLAGQLGDAGWRAELARLATAQGAPFGRVLLALDYAFANTLSLSVECYRDGSGARAPAGYDFTALASGARQTLARHYAGLHASYEITPLLRLSADYVRNLDDRSRFLSPALSYSILPNLDWALGFQHFSGSQGSEYARPPNRMYTSLQWFF